MPDDQNPNNSHGGMSLRDYFAAQAMAGMLTNGHGPTAFWIIDKPRDGRLPLTEKAYQIADAMLAERAAGAP
jgi:hypothetical protein